MTDGGDPSPAGAAQTGWRRLHPLSPLVGSAGHAVVAIVLVMLSAPRRPGSASARLALALAALAVLAAIAAVIRWLVTRWRLHRGELQIDTGLIRRQSYRIPLSRIQAVDIISPFMARVFGLAEVRVVVAGRGAGRTRLAYLPAEEAQRVRGRLLALAHGLHAETPEPPSHPLLEVDNGRVARSAVLSPGGAFVVVVAVLDVALTTLSGRSETLTVLLPWLVIGGGGVFRAVNANFSFRVDEAPDGLRLSRGLLQTRAETIPYGRIQAVRWVEPLLWRPFGWCRVEVDVARQRSADRGQEGGTGFSRNLLPVGRREEAAFLLARALPGATADPPPASRPPRRAALRAPFSYHHLAAWHDDRHLCARTGRVRPSTVVVPLHKVQSLRLRTGPLLRLLRLATLHADTAGRGWQAAARCRDAGEARRLLEILPELARRARARAAASPDRSPPSPQPAVASEG